MRQLWFSEGNRFASRQHPFYILRLFTFDPQNLLREVKKEFFLDQSLDYSYSLDNNTYKLARISFGGGGGEQGISP